MTSCPADDLLRGLLADAPDGAVSEAVAAHLEVCARCRERLDEWLRQQCPAGVQGRHGAPSDASETGRRFLDQLIRHPPTDGAGPSDTGAGDSTATSDSVSGRASGAPLPELPGYVMLAEIGQGGAGVVYKARHTGLNRLVAVKMLHPGHRVRPEQRERFRAEAEAVARLQHPNVVQVYEVGEAAGVPFYTMELVEAGSLARCLTGTPQPAAAAARLVATLAGAVHAAHQHGLIHRDLKPANVLLASGVASAPRGLAPSLTLADPRGANATPLADLVPKIADFGLAKWLDRDGSLTPSGAVMGTPSYMPPEQADATRSPVGPAADVYSLGAILYEMLAGRPPFRAETPVETVIQVLHEEPVPPGRLRPGLPRDLEAICLKCLEKEPRRRYATAAALADDLERYLAGRPTVARPVRALGRVVRWGRRNPAVACLAVMLGLAVAGGGAAVTWKWLEADEQRGRAVAETTAKNDALDRAETDLYSYGITLAYGEYRANRLQPAEQILDTCPPRLRHWEWHYLKRLCRPDELTLSGHGNTRTMAFSPDGQLIGTAGDHLVLWDATTGKTRFVLPPARPGSSLTPRPGKGVWFSSDGRCVADVRGFLGPNKPFVGMTRVWDARTGEEMVHLSEARYVADLAFSAAGDRMTLVDQTGTVRIKDVQTGQVVRTMPRFVAHDRAPFYVALSRDGTLVASVGLASSPTIKVHDIEGGTPAELKFSAATNIVTLEFSPDGNSIFLISSDQVRIYQYERAGRRLQLVATLATPGVRQVAYDLTGRRFATLCQPNQVRIWDTASGRALFDVRHPSASILRVALSPDGQRVALAGAADTVRAETVRIVRADSAPEMRIVASVNRTQSADVSRDGHTLVHSNADKTVSIHDTRTGQEVRRLPPHPSLVRSIRISPDGLTLACCCADMSVHIWPLDGGPQLATYLWHQWSGPDSAQQPNWSWRISFSPDSQCLAAFFPDNAIHVWEARSGRQLRLIPGQVDGAPPTGLDFSINGGRLLAITRSALRVWTVETGEELFTRVTPPESLYRRLLCRPQTDEVAVGCSDGTIHLFNAVNGDVVTTLKGHASMILVLAFSPDGRRLISASEDRVMKLWDLTTRRELLSFPEHALTAQFSSDGTRLYTAAVETSAAPIKLWDGRPFDLPAVAGNAVDGDLR